jgi:hypothetical protein
VQDVPVADVERLQDNRALRVNTSPENRSMFLGMNVGVRDLRSSSLKDKNPFADRRVRARDRDGDRPPAAATRGYGAASRSRPA